jgi:hypothetical protein
VEPGRLSKFNRLSRFMNLYATVRRLGGPSFLRSARVISLLVQCTACPQLQEHQPDNSPTLVDRLQAVYLLNADR